MRGTELMDRIRDEIAAAKNDYIAMMGEMMTEYLREHGEAEVSDKKTLQGAYTALRAQAQKKQKGGCYAMSPQEVFNGMMEYFELPHAHADYAACMLALFGQTAPDRVQAEAPIKPAEDIFDLDALLGG